MYKRILVAMDGSHTSELALREAINLAKAIDAQLLLVHAVDEVGSTWYAGGHLTSRLTVPRYGLMMSLPLP